MVNIEAGRMIIFSFIFFLFQNTFTLCHEGNHDNTKRMLLNDQDVAGQLNRNIQSLTQLVNTMKTEMDAQKADITALEGKVSSQKVEITTQKAEIAGQKQEIATQKAEVAAQKAAVAKLTAKISNAGSTYIRWGRTSCSTPNTQLVYQGYTTGQHYHQYSDRYGGPANYLCLPNDPELSNLTTQSNSFLWGTEFEENIIKPDAANEDVPCAVCKSTDTHVSIMIPGRTTCYGGWKVEYNGLLASDNYAFSASSFICVDRNPEYIPSGKRDDNGRLLYVTRTKCGALPCPPYTDGKAVNCVVCSQ